ncbi:MAG TPA: hypothetical protein VEJ21_02655 [Acidimicrobiales bacterium]|nr:hypothetical protein [Acidimicrobiales bacterium]
MSRQAENAVDDIAGADLPPAPAGIGVGAAVCVWNYYLQQWSDGFVVAEALTLGYRVRRSSDGQVLDHLFTGEEVMVERRRVQTPGYDGTLADRRHR